MSRQRLLPAAVVLLTLAVFCPVITFGFVDLDDFTNIVRNPLLNPFNFEHLRWIWSHAYDAMFIPMTYTLWGFLSLIRDENGQMVTGVFHAANLVVHVVNVAVVYAILKQLIESRLPVLRTLARSVESERVKVRTEEPKAQLADQPSPLPSPGGRAGWLAVVLASVVFAIHPIQVESVAWISSFRDLLAALFVLLSLWQLLKLNESPRHAIFVFLFLGVGLLCKPSAVVMPLMAIALLFYRGKRPTRRGFWTIVGAFLLVIPCLIWTKSLQPGGPQFGHPPALSQRPLIALDAIGFYLSKIVWPARLGVEYSRTPQYVLESHSFYWIAAAAVIVLAVISWRRKVVAIFGLFIAAIIPVLGLVPFNYQFFSTVADHYVYLGMLAVALGVNALLERFPPVCSTAAKYVLIGILIALSARSIVQILTWQNSFTLFSRNVAINPRSYISHFHLGQFYEQHRDLPRAEDELKAALRISPHYSVARTELGLVLLHEGKTDAGLDELLASLNDAKLEDPQANLSAAYQRIGQMLQQRGRTKEAEECFREAAQGH